MPDKQNDPSYLNDIPHERKEPRPDFTDPPPPTKLPKSIENTLNDEQKWWETLYEGKSGESTDSSVRYAAYAARLRTILLAAHRYVAYTSDIGESFRPVAHPNLVRGAYAISWLYIGGDVGYEGYKAYLRQQRVLHPERQKDAPTVAKTSGTDIALPPAAESTALVPRKVPAIDDYRSVMAERAVFQSLASMGLPAFTIHTIVRYSGRAMKNVKNVTLRTWGPIGLGLAAVPALPYLFDKPVEHAVRKVFYEGFKFVGGPKAVGEGFEDLNAMPVNTIPSKDKEL